MKNVLMAVMLLGCALPTLAQVTSPGSSSHYDEYMQRSRRKERAGIILLSSGAAVTAGGIILIIDGANRNKRNGDYNGNGELNTGEAEVVLGALVTVMGVAGMSASIPFFVGAHRTKIKAMALSIKTETAPSLFKNAAGRQAFPALAIHVPLGR